VISTSEDDNLSEILQLNVTMNDLHGKVIDSTKMEAKLVLNGYEQQQSHARVISLDSTSVSETLVFPASMIGQPTFKVLLYTSSLDNILSAVESLIKKPYGCFEQTSATTYPMVMALKLLGQLKLQYEAVDNQEMVTEIEEMQVEIKGNLKDGYDKLVGFETSSKGYEWFGDAPGHEALTSYGIAQFSEMSKLVDFVDKNAIERNAVWLKSQRKNDGTGQFKINPRALDTFGRASQNVTDVYILWILSALEGYDQTTMKEEFDNLEKVALHTNDPYLLGLCAGALINLSKLEDAYDIASRIAALQNSTSGAVEGAETSITSSSGMNLKVETTSLALLAWLDTDPSSFSI